MSDETRKTPHVAGKPSAPRPTIKSTNQRIDAMQAEQDRKWQRLSELLEVKLPIDYALGALKLTEDQVRKDLNIPEGVELTNAVLVEALIRHAKRTGERLTTLEHEVYAPTGRIPKLQRGVAGLDSEVNRNSAHIGKLESDFAQLDKLLKGNLQEALKAGASGGEKSFIRTLRAKGVSDDDIRKAFSILKQDGDGELDLGDADMFGELFREFVSFRETTTETLEEQGTKLEELRKDVVLIEGAHRELREEIKTVKADGGAPLVGTLIAAVIGVIVFFALWKHDWHNGPRTTSGSATAKGVKVHVTNTQNYDIPFAHWWFDLLVAVLVFVAFVCIFWMLARSKTTTKTSRTATTAPIWGKVRSVRGSRKAKRTARNQQAKEERNNGSELIKQLDSNESNDGKTIVLPVVDEKGHNREHQKVS